MAESRSSLAAGGVSCGPGTLQRGRVYGQCSAEFCFVKGTSVRVGSLAAGSSQGACESLCLRGTHSVQIAGTCWARAGDVDCDLASPRPEPVSDSHRSRRQRHAAHRVSAWLGLCPVTLCPVEPPWAWAWASAQRVQIAASRVSVHGTWYQLTLPLIRSSIKWVTWGRAHIIFLLFVVFKGAYVSLHLTLQKFSSSPLTREQKGWTDTGTSRLPAFKGIGVHVKVPLLFPTLTNFTFVIVHFVCQFYEDLRDS